MSYSEDNLRRLRANKIPELVEATKQKLAALQIELSDDLGPVIPENGELGFSVLMPGMRFCVSIRSNRKAKLLVTRSSDTSLHKLRITLRGPVRGRIAYWVINENEGRCEIDSLIKTLETYKQRLDNPGPSPAVPPSLTCEPVAEKHGRSAAECASTDITAARDRLVAVVRTLAAEKRADLERLKEGASGLTRPDFIWHYLLQSFSTMQGVAGHRGLICNEDNYRRVTYSVLTALSPKDREAQVKAVCLAAEREGLRYANNKAKYILDCFDYVTDLGGLEAAKAKLLALPGREAKIQFLDAFPGIGPKYARNIMMDVYHEDFWASIALDSRIRGISKGLGLTFASYEEEEAFYLEVARMAGLNGWELDRLLFNFSPEVKSRLGVS